MRLAHGVFHQRAIFAAHPQVLQRQAPGLLVEQAQHHPLAVGRRQRGHADVHLAPPNLERDTPVLRDAFLGDIQPRHHLDPRDQQGRQLALGFEHFTQDAVHAKTHHQALLEGFQVNVGGVLLDRFAENRVDQADDRRVVLLFQQVLGFRHLIGQRRQIETAADVLGQLHGCGVMLIGRPQCLGELAGAHRLQRQAAPGETLRLGQCHRVAVEAIAQAGAAVMHDEHHAMALGEAERQAAQRSVVQRSVHA